MYYKPHKKVISFYNSIFYISRDILRKLKKILRPNKNNPFIKKQK